MTPEIAALLCVSSFMLGIVAYHFMLGGPR